MNDHPVAVVGASLAGLAVAARLAKQGHRVVLFEASDVLGGRWARPGALPPVFTLPAPWRDLFRKSGRAFDVELARTGHALVPAPPAVHRFDDGTSLVLPTDRGEQWTALSAAWGSPAAIRWRDLLDLLDERWQVLRRLGLEDELLDSDLTSRRRVALGLTRTVEHLARGIGHPQAAALLRSTARRIGSDPARTPGFVAVRLALERTFGRWQLTRDERPVPASDLLELLTARLELRRVEVRAGEPVTALRSGVVVTASGQLVVSATVSAVNPWEHLRLVTPGERTLRRRTSWTRPAVAPQIAVSAQQRVGFTTDYGVETNSLSSTGADARVDETVEHTRSGVRVRYRLPDQEIVHDFTSGSPSPGFGTRWTSSRTWLRMPQLRAETPGVFTASASSRGGNDPWAHLLSGALAGYVVHETLTGADIRPTNKAVKP